MKARSLLASLALISVGVFAPAASAQATGCAGSLANGDFEVPVLTTLSASDILVSGGNPVWNGPGSGTTYALIKALPTTDTAVSQELIWESSENAVELQNSTPFTGDQYGEIVGLDPTAALYQEVSTTPGQYMEWSITHRGYSSLGEDSMQVEIGSSLADLVAQNATPDTGSGVAGDATLITDGDTWRTWTGSYTVPAGQTTTFFAFHAVSSYGGGASSGNFVDDIKFSCATPNAAESTLANTGSDSSTLSIMTGVALSTLVIGGAILAYLRRRKA